MVTKIGSAYVRFFGHNEKIITGLTEPDTNKHYLDLSKWIPKDTVAIIIGVNRTSGTGRLRVFPNEGSHYLLLNPATEHTKTVAIKNRRLQYALSIANDVFDVFLWGYFVEYPIARLKKEG